MIDRTFFPFFKVDTVVETFILLVDLILGFDKMPKEIHEIKDFLLTARTKDAKSVKIMKKQRQNESETHFLLSSCNYALI